MQKVEDSVLDIYWIKVFKKAKNVCLILALIFLLYVAFTLLNKITTSKLLIMVLPAQ